MKILAEQGRLFLVALQFFTRVPIHSTLVTWMDWTPQRLSASSRYFPLVGVLIGGIAGLVYVVFAPLLGAMLASICAISASAWITGAFHEDGFADYFDSFGAGPNRAKALDIMKDSRIGTFGALALVLLSACKVAALTRMSVVEAAVALVCAHTLGRAAACAILAQLDYVRHDATSKSKPLAERMHPSELCIALLIGIAVLVTGHIIGFIPLEFALLLTLCVTITTMLFSRHLQKRLGGFTGDTLGAAEQLIEVVVLLLFASSNPWL